MAHGLRRPFALAALVPALAAWPGAAEASHSGAPVLQLASRQPLAVRGVGFGRNARLVVRFRVAGASMSRVVRANGLGGFTLVAPATFAYDPCSDALTVSAGGAQRNATLLHVPRRLCPVG